MPRKTSPENDLIISAGGAAPRRQAATHSRSKRSTKISEISASPIASSITMLEPSQDEIAALAFSYWEARGCQGGSAEEDWLRAEQHLRSLQAVAANA